MYKIFVFICLGFLLVTGCEDKSTEPGGNPPANEIWIQNNSFNPASITIAAGTTLTWVNKDQGAHTSTSGNGSPTGVFDSNNLGSGGSFSFTFNTVNSFEYYCKIHPNMRGTVIVQ